MRERGTRLYECVQTRRCSWHDPRASICAILCHAEREGAVPANYFATRAKHLCDATPPTPSLGTLDAASTTHPSVDPPFAPPPNTRSRPPRRGCPIRHGIDETPTTLRCLAGVRPHRPAQTGCTAE